MNKATRLAKLETLHWFRYPDGERIAGLRHGGPGPPKSGTPQDVHGGGNGGDSDETPRKDSGRQPGDEITVDGARGPVTIIAGSLENRRFNDFDEDEPDAAALARDVERAGTIDDYGYRETDDDYLYHVTSPEGAEEIPFSGITIGNAPTMENWGGYSDGKVFFTERSGVNFWHGKVEEHLFATQDDPGDPVIFRVLKTNVRGTLQTDAQGTRDAGYNNYSYFVERD